MAQCAVEFFNSQTGFGFIQPTDGGADVFVHISAVERAGMSTLNEGHKLTYDVVSGRGNLSALRCPPRKRQARRRIPPPLRHHCRATRPGGRGTRRCRPDRHRSAVEGVSTGGRRPPDLLRSRHLRGREADHRRAAKPLENVSFRPARSEGWRSRRSCRPWHRRIRRAQAARDGKSFDVRNGGRPPGIPRGPISGGRQAVCSSRAA